MCLNTQLQVSNTKSEAAVIVKKIYVRGKYSVWTLCENELKKID